MTRSALSDILLHFYTLSRRSKYPNPQHCWTAPQIKIKIIEKFKMWRENEEGENNYLLIYKMSPTYENIQGVFFFTGTPSKSSKYKQVNLG